MPLAAPGLLRLRLARTEKHPAKEKEERRNDAARSSTRVVLHPGFAGAPREDDAVVSCGCRSRRPDHPRRRRSGWRRCHKETPPQRPFAAMPSPPGWSRVGIWPAVRGTSVLGATPWACARPPPAPIIIAADSKADVSGSLVMAISCSGERNWVRAEQPSNKLIFRTRIDRHRERSEATRDPPSIPRAAPGALRFRLAVTESRCTLKEVLANRSLR